jgi:hypothetical protein
MGGFSDELKYKFAELIQLKTKFGQGIGRLVPLSNNISMTWVVPMVAQ